MFELDFGAPRRPTRRHWGSATSRATPYPNPYEKKEPSLDQLVKGLGEIVTTIPLPSSEVGISVPVTIKDFKPVASYSWMDDKSPTILVPGSPPTWRERQMPFTVPRNIGTVFVDQNAFRLGTSPLLPLIEAVSYYSPDFPLGTMDFVTDRNGLRKITRWATGSAKQETFRIDMELVGTKTVLMQRWEPQATQDAGPGYEIGFENASTTPGVGCEQASGHHRIVTYDLGGLKLLVRFKGDACLPHAAPKKKQVLDPLDALTAGLQSLSVSQPPHKVTKTPNGSLSIISRGEFVPQSSLLELKTRSLKFVDGFDWEDTYAQLLLSNTPNIHLCLHERGEFKKVQKKTLEELKTSEIARRANDGMRMLWNILVAIHETMEVEGEGAKLSLVCKPGREMIIYERGGKNGSLPEQTYKLFRSKD